MRNPSQCQLDELFGTHNKLIVNDLDVCIKSADLKTLYDFISESKTLFRLCITDSSSEVLLTILDALQKNRSVSEVVITGCPRDLAYNVAVRKQLEKLLMKNTPIKRLYLHELSPIVRDMTDVFNRNYQILELTYCCYYSGFECCPRNSRNCEISESLQRNKLLANLLGLTIALLPLNLPPYVLLWVTDWLPGFSSDNDKYHYRKIRLIEAITKAYRRIRSNKHKT